MYFNPETLYYKLNQTVFWKEEEKFFKGRVINVTFYGLEVLKENQEKVFVGFEKITKK
jgi:hypothetical protein